MIKQLALVLNGSRARGALQVGALRALLEYSILSDMLVGTSIGPLNATFLALNGFSIRSLDLLTLAWEEAASCDLLPANDI